ncbi:MAG: formate dehydrogenase accessory protein FdhE [Actinomycetota bacterium]
MKGLARGGPGELDVRVARAAALETTADAPQPLAFLRAVLERQRDRIADPVVQAAAEEVGADALANRLVERFPLLDLHAGIPAMDAEIRASVAALSASDAAPQPLIDAGGDLVARSEEERATLIGSWLDDTSLLDPRLALWVRVGAAPVLEVAASPTGMVAREEWTGPACPVCGDVPQCSAIVEESGGFLQGAPRYLVCGRCAGWWAFARAVCTHCGEDNSTRLGAFVAEGRPWARIDACDTCRGYIKTFDLRQKEARDVVPIVDDVATLSLDVWAHEKGLRRSGLSLAGV